MSEAPVIARVSPTPARRVLGVGFLGSLGALLLWLGLGTPEMPVAWRLFLLAGAGIGVWGAQKLWAATAVSLELTAEVLRDSAGREIARVADVTGVDRGALAFKPSNGFLVHTTTPAGRAWAPGLWWRLGKRIGVGGVTSAGEAKFMAEALSLLLKDPSLVPGGDPQDK